MEFHELQPTGKNQIFEDNSIAVYSFPLKHRVECFGFLFQEKPRELRIDKDKIQAYNLTLEEILKAKKGINIKRGDELIVAEDVTLPPEKPVSYAFCTDTKYLPHLADWVQGATLLYHEATFTEALKDRAKVTFHSTALEAATVAKAAGVGQLLLGHFSARYKDTTPILEEATTIFDKVTCVEDGDTFLA